MIQQRIISAGISRQNLARACIFFTNKRRVYIRPHTLTINNIACDYLDLKSELAELSQGPKCEQLIIQTAAVLCSQVRNEIKEQTWPPKPDELTDKYIVLPACLTQFLQILIGGREALPSD